MEYVIESSNMTKSYGNTVVVDRVNIHVRKGEIYGLLGRNGAGKTTIMKMIVGLTDMDSGSISVFGKQMKGNEKELLSRIGALIETPGFYPNLTAYENLNNLARLRGVVKKNAVGDSLEVVGLPRNDKKIYSEFSIGMKQRLGIAASLMHSPELLILDEPINGLDPIGISEMRRFLKELSEVSGKTIVLSSHILSEIELLADTVGIIHEGKLLEESSLTELQRKNEKYLLIKATPVEKVAHILDEKYPDVYYQIPCDNEVRIYNMDLDMAHINRVLLEQGINVFAFSQCNDSLEDYFKKITGGGAIG